MTCCKDRYITEYLCAHRKAECGNCPPLTIPPELVHAILHVIVRQLISNRTNTVLLVHTIYVQIFEGCNFHG